MKMINGLKASTKKGAEIFMFPLEDGKYSITIVPRDGRDEIDISCTNEFLDLLHAAHQQLRTDYDTGEVNETHL